ncbi:hypothetical protein ACC690_38770, partial [Rhizobium johnstonii]
AAIIEDSHKRLPLIFNAWTFAAVSTSALGILGYFHAFPGAEIFTLYDLAKGACASPSRCVPRTWRWSAAASQGWRWEPISHP